MVLIMSKFINAFVSVFDRSSSTYLHPSLSRPVQLNSLNFNLPFVGRLNVIMSLSNAKTNRRVIDIERVTADPGGVVAVSGTSKDRVFELDNYAVLLGM